jgi:hypothetical protein
MIALIIMLLLMLLVMLCHLRFTPPHHNILMQGIGSNPGRASLCYLKSFLSELLGRRGPKRDSVLGNISTSGARTRACRRCTAAWHANGGATSATHSVKLPLFLAGAERAACPDRCRDCSAAKSAYQGSGWLPEGLPVPRRAGLCAPAPPCRRRFGALRGVVHPCRLERCSGCAALLPQGWILTTDSFRCIRAGLHSDLCGERPGERVEKGREEIAEKGGGEPTAEKGGRGAH